MRAAACGSTAIPGKTMICRKTVYARYVKSRITRCQPVALYIALIDLVFWAGFVACAFTWVHLLWCIYCGAFIVGLGMHYVLAKLYGTAPPAHAVGLESAVAEVYGVLRNTVVQQRGQQCVLLGARGTGKTLVVNKALEKFEAQYPREALVVRVSGLSHSDDRLALREIAKQLDAALGANAIERPSMSQTLKAINQLFTNTQQAAEGSGTQFVRVVFVIEELEKFVANHQVLVYELLDLSLSAPTGVAVVATSTRMNVLDLLEKRNRSRNFASHLVLPKPASVDALRAIGRELLTTERGDVLLDDGELGALCEEVWFTTNSVRHLQALLLPRVLASPDLTVPGTAALLLRPVEAVPEMDWALLICAARVRVRYETPAVNLVLVLDEWRALVYAMQANRFAELTARSSTNAKPGSTPASLRAVRHSWERLRQMGLLEPTVGQSTQDDLRMFTPELNLDDLRGMLPKSYTLYGWTRVEA